MSPGTARSTTADRVGGARSGEQQAGQGTAPPDSRARTVVATATTAVEMTSLWKPQTGFHRDLEISQRTRDSHISTSRFLLVAEEETGTNDGATRRYINRPLVRRSLGHTADRQEQLSPTGKSS